MRSTFKSVKRENLLDIFLCVSQPIPTASTYIFGEQFERWIHSLYACLTTPHRPLVRRRWIPFRLLLFPHTFMYVLTVRSLGIHSALLPMHFIRLVFGVRDTWSVEHWAMIVRRTLFYVFMQLGVRSSMAYVFLGIGTWCLWLYWLRHAYVFVAENRSYSLAHDDFMSE